MLRVNSRNINQRVECWRALPEMDGVDVALLQEAKAPPPEVRSHMTLDMDTQWATGGTWNRPWRTCVVGLSDRVVVEPLPVRPLDAAAPGEIGVSRTGTIAAARVTVRETGEQLTAVSLYGAWESPLPDTASQWIYADASVHRLISDVSIVIGRQQGHRVIAAGDLNVLRGYGEAGSPYWKGRYQTIFDRFEAIGLPCLGPSLPHGGQPPIRMPEERPPESATVPTYRTERDNPESATRQLDFVFASDCLVRRLRTEALNDPARWGDSDHCRIAIDLGAEASASS